MTSGLLAKKIAQLALTKKAERVTIMDLRKVTDMSDFFVVCSGASDIQVKAIADAIADGTEEAGLSPWHREGLTQSQWILLDYVDVVVHVFHTDMRKYYALEKLWGDAKIEVVEDIPAPKKAAPKKSVAKKPAVKKTAAKKATPKKPVVKKAVPKKPARKPARKKKAK